MKVSRLVAALTRRPEDQAKNFNRDENLRVVPSGTELFDLLIGWRQDSESFHSQAEYAFHGHRLPAYHPPQQTLVLLGLALRMNAVSRYVHAGHHVRALRHPARQMPQPPTRPSHSHQDQQKPGGSLRSCAPPNTQASLRRPPQGLEDPLGPNTHQSYGLSSPSGRSLTGFCATPRARSSGDRAGAF